MIDRNKFAPSNASFDPETLNLLSDAFEDAWLKIRTSGNRLARPGYANVMREVMAKHIIHLAQRGERDEIALSNSAVNFFYRQLQSIGRSSDQFFWMMQSPPAAFSPLHSFAAISADAKGPTSAR